MKKQCKSASLLGLLLGAVLLLLSGCGNLFPPIRLAEEASAPAALEISLDPEALEDISVVWDPPGRMPEWAEISVDARRSETERSVTVTVRLTPGQ